ncbi:M66 family metalloprotease [Leptothrix ochracea]|uniref:M66 family metalloprotease n=1 Tax=Leptothrix ochracea TaxID=735331 RepID=UPI0034E2D245
MKITASSIHRPLRAFSAASVWLATATWLVGCSGGHGGHPYPSTGPALVTAPAGASFRPTLFRPEPPPLQSMCAATPVTGANATLARVWLAQTHLMEPGWAFWNLVQDRGALLKVDVVDVSAPASAGTAAPQISVQASWAGGSATRCMVAPATLPTTVDMDPQPQRQDLASSYTLTLPRDWMRPDLSLTVSVAGGPSRTLTPADLRLETQPQLEMVLTDVLLFGDTTPRDQRSLQAEFAARFPFTAVAFYAWPQPLTLPRLVIAPRSDGRTAQGITSAQPAVWADRLPSCTAAEQSAGQCTLYSDFGVIAASLSLMSQLKQANGMAATSVWFGGLGAHSGGGGGLGGGQQASGSDYQLIFNHEVGHALSLPHLGDVTAAHQTAVTGLLDPYIGETVNAASVGGYVGGGFGKTTAYDALDNTLMPWGCHGTLVEAQDPMQRGCNNVASGRLFDHFSDFATVQMQRYWLGSASAYAGSVPYWSSLIPGSSSAAPQAAAFNLPQQGGTVQADWRSAITNAAPNDPPTLTRYNPATRSQEIVLRPPGDDGFVKPLPTAPAGSSYDSYYDFRFPQQYNVPVITVVGAFNGPDDALSAVLGVFKTQGHLLRLWDPTDPVTFNLIKQSISGDSFWWGWNLHLRVEYADGSFRHVALHNDVSAAAFSHWAVNLPDDGRVIRRISLLHRPLCVRNGAATDRSCDISVAANGITAANIYQGARTAAVWSP